MSELIITSGSGRVFLYNSEDDSISLIFETENNNEYFMGVTKYNDKIIISSNYTIYFLKEENGTWGCVGDAEEGKGNPLFAHMKNIGGYLFLPMQSSNIVSVADLNKIEPVGAIDIKANYVRTNFDNVTGIEFYNEHFFVTCNSYYNEDSCVVVIDKNFNYTDKLVYGWNLYSFGFIDNIYCGLCNHIYETDKFPCLVVGSDIKFKAPNYYRFIGMSANEQFFFIVGSAVIPQENLAPEYRTTVSGGVILILRRDNYKVEKIKIISGLGQFLGCLLLRENDLLNDRYNEHIDLSQVKFNKKKVKKVEVIQ